MGFEPHILNLLEKIRGFFSQDDTHAYIVGGFLRDLILNRPSEDIDLAVTTDIAATGPRLASLLGGRFINLDEATRIGRITLPGTAGTLASIKHLDLNTIRSDIRTDLARRDFSINAMALPLAGSLRDIPAEIIDPYNGMRAIREKTVSAVSNRVFAEDGLRLLRGIRISTELGFAIEPDTLSLMHEHAHYIQNIAGERIREELIRIFNQSGTGNIILLMDELGLLERLIPELGPCKETQQPKEHHWPVFGHSVKCVDAFDFLLGRGSWPYTDESVREPVPWSAKIERHFSARVTGESTRREITKIAALLHDIAKPETRTLNSQGRIRFYSHPARGAPVTRTILTRLRFSSREINMVAGLTHHHLRPVQLNKRGEQPTDRAIYRYLRDTEDVAIDTVYLSLADHLSARGPDLEPGFWREHCRVAGLVMQRIEGLKQTRREPRLINGHDLLDNFRLSPGPLIKTILEAVAEAQAVGEISTRKQALELAERLINTTDLEEVDRSGYRRGKGTVKPK